MLLEEVARALAGVLGHHRLHALALLDLDEDRGSGHGTLRAGAASGAVCAGRVENLEHAPVRDKRLVATLGLGILALVLAMACGAEDPELRLVGTVERDLVELAAPISEVIVAIHAERGEPVEAERLIVELDPTLARVEVTRAEALLAGARTGAVVAEHELGRVRKLRRDRVSSEQDMERAELARDEAQARLREAQAVLAAAFKRARDLRLVAPVAGVVDQLPFDVGERVPAGAVVAVILADTAPWVRVWMPEPSLAGVRPGTPARIDPDGVTRPLRGTVLDVAREPEFTPHYALTERDRVLLVYETRVRIEDPPAGLRPGLPAEVRLLPEPPAPGAP